MSDEERDVEPDDLADPIDDPEEGTTYVTTGEENEHGVAVPKNERITVIYPLSKLCKCIQFQYFNT